MLFLDAIFRFSGIGLLLFLALVSLRDARSWKSSLYLALSCVSLAALLIGYAPDPLLPPEPIYAFARFIDIPHLVFVWLLALSLFDKSFRLRAVHILIGILYCAPIVWLRLNEFSLLPALPNWIFIYGSLTSVALMFHLCYATLRGRPDDLLVARRKSRVYFVIVIVFVALAAAVIDPLPNTIGQIDKRTAKMLSIWPAIMWCGVWLLALNQRSAHFGEIAGSGRALAHQDQTLQKKLDELVREKEVFREPKLSISDLASRLGVTQHRLRSLINEGLGYSNFSAYINSYRIEAVKAAITNSESASLPVLSIAMDCGFTSLSTFNKTFKALEGVTPTDYRKGLKT